MVPMDTFRYKARALVALAAMALFIAGLSIAGLALRDHGSTAGAAADEVAAVASSATQARPGVVSAPRPVTTGASSTSGGHGDDEHGAEGDDREQGSDD